METFLELSHITKVFPGVKALDDVQFDTHSGEIHALLGENGAGKSTLIKIISGVYKPNEGEIRLDGQPIHFNNPHEAQQKGIATIYQELSLFPELTVAENIFLGHAPHRRVGPFRRLDWRTMNAEARRLLASLNIHDLDPQRNIGSLSVGNRQRVEIVKALSLNARVLIMDEPTASLTEADVERLFEIVRLLRERRVAIIYISHRLQEVYQLADRVTVLRDGKYIATKPVSETKERDLISMMVMRSIDNMFPKLEGEIGEPVLEVRHLTREPVTRDVSFQVRAGEIVGLAGLVGAGRSELGQALFGTLPARSGEIYVNGKRAHIRHPAHSVQLGIAYVPEDRGTQGLVKQMTVRENISLAVLRALSYATFIDPRKERSVAKEAIQQLNIRTYSLDQIVNKLSGGNQQKIVVSKWLASKPRVLIMDEPTRGIDVGTKAEIHRLMSELAVRRRMAILMISSELPEILGMSDRVLVMREGRIVAEFSRAEATQEKIASAMMGAQATDSALEEQAALSATEGDR
jgi:rhamnose transport system ATP-binding protein